MTNSIASESPTLKELFASRDQHSPFTITPETRTGSVPSWMEASKSNEHSLEQSSRAGCRYQLAALERSVAKPRWPITAPP